MREEPALRGSRAWAGHHGEAGGFEKAMQACVVCAPPARRSRGWVSPHGLGAQKCGRVRELLGQGRELVGEVGRQAPQERGEPGAKRGQLRRLGAPWRSTAYVVKVLRTTLSRNGVNVWITRVQRDTTAKRPTKTSGSGPGPACCPQAPSRTQCYRYMRLLPQCGHIGSAATLTTQQTVPALTEQFNDAGQLTRPALCTPC